MMTSQAPFLQSKNPILGNITEFASRHGITALKFYLLSVARKLDTDPRLRICHRYKLPKAETVDLVEYTHLETGQRTPGIRGTMKCSRFWQCPLCAGRIGVHRRDELRMAINNHPEYVRVMVTYTARHGVGDSLQTTLDGLLRAYRKMRSGRWWQSVKEEFYLVGGVRATEITYGDSGWHPHFHELLFIDAHAIGEGWISVEELTEALQTLMVKKWRDALQASGLDASIERGINVSSRTADVAAYINKFAKMPQESGAWGDSGEIALSPAKTARSGSQTPFEILFEAAHSPEHARLWAEYVRATKGKAALIWSRGTKAMLGIDEIRDQDIADDTDILPVMVIHRFTADQWDILWRMGAIAPLIAAAQAQSFERVWYLVDRVEEALAGKDLTRCHKHGIPLSRGEKCPVCEWEAADYGA